MKKLLLVLGMLTCMLGMTACGAKESVAVENQLGITEETAISYADGVVESINEIVVNGEADYYMGDPVVSTGLESWSTALEIMGEYQEITGHTVEISTDEVIIQVNVNGTNRAAVVDLIIDETGALSSITTNVTKTFGELMTNAALNTLLGVGTVFCVLIFIAWLISLFKFIPNIQAKFKKKEVEAVKEVPKAVPVVETAVEEELSDDYELVAVIAAAIAASEGAATTDGFVVRSIRKSNKTRWQRA